jgi:hypothetical protein
MRAVLTQVRDGKIVDTVTVDDDGGEPEFDTGAAETIVQDIRAIMGDEWLEALADWSNGYLELHEVGAATTAAEAEMAGYDPNQPRDRKGRWTDGRGVPSASKPDAPSKPSTPAAPKRGGGDGKPAPKPEPKREAPKPRTPEQTLAAAPKDVEGTGARKIDKAGTAALERYRGKDFSTINKSLRGTGDEKKPAWVDGVVSKIDAVHAQSKLTDDVVVHRGIGDVEAVFGPAAAKKLTGAEWKDEAFQSTTADADIAERFMIGEKGRRGAAVMKIRVPKGTGAIQMSDARYEAEMLLERGLRMRVVSDTGPWRRGQKNPRVIEVEVVPA